jgi:hypothetical protein
MIKIREWEIPNQITELTIKQFQTVSQIQNDQGYSFVEKQTKIFEYLGVPDIWDEVSVKELKGYIDEFNEVPKVEFEYTKEIEIDGYTYRSYEGEDFELTAKDLSIIEKKIKPSESDVSYLMAVIFKRTDLSKNEHYTEAHLKQKAKLFEDQPAEMCIKFLSKIGEEVTNVLQKNVS